MSTGELPSPSQKTPGQRLRTKFWHLTGLMRAKAISATQSAVAFHSTALRRDRC
jgi:hypothetical protein